ncbi:MAG: segregation/condensation protein A [Deltaproteobacteria bacterium]|nr:segregation/condensation protein A [Deltaproteobacteria bacterium]
MKPRAEESLDPEEVDRADAYRVKLDVFEGPLDLLLHLVKKHELDILDIPIGFVTQKYLEYLAVMQEVTIDLASEYLVMAATLTYIKSRMLLPVDPAQGGDDDGSEEELDPRADLIRRLLEYQKYREAADRLGDRPGPGRDMFERGTMSPIPEGPAPFAPVSVFRLFDVFSKLLEKTTKKPVEHHVHFEEISISERMVQLSEVLAKRRRMGFEELLLTVPVGGPESVGVEPSRFDLIITFLAVLEMCKMRVARVFLESDDLGDLVVEFHAKTLNDGVPLPGDTGGEDREPVVLLEDAPAIEEAHADGHETEERDG